MIEKRVSCLKLIILKKMSNKVIYIASANIPKNGGVSAKIDGTLSAARQLGYQTEFFGYGNGIKSTYATVWRGMVLSDASNIFFRRVTGWLNITLIPVYLMARLQGKRIIIDIPTPIKAQIGEILNTDSSRIKKLRHIIYEYIAGPIPYWCFNTIIQYGDEGAYFAFGNKKRTVMLGNGIDPERIKLREKLYGQDNNTINLVGVAYLSVYHGFDRIIKVIAQWNQTNNKKYVFHIIGDNPGTPILESLKNQAEKLNVSEYVVFHGIQNQQYIYKYYSQCDMAVGSLGLFRIDLITSSILKSREYCLAGIPFITAGKDYDFTGDIPFCFNVSNDDSIDDILQVFKSFPERRKTFTDEQIRQYAIEHLTFEAKLTSLGFQKITE